jgi:aminoglycoside phosphotransferase (APT) family kinase protein
MAGLARADFDWLRRFEAIKNRSEVAGAREEDSASAAAPIEKLVSKEAMTAYLRQKLPHLPDVTVAKVTAVSGGRSKRTIAIAVDNIDELPAQLIMRQDLVMKYINRTVKDEVIPLQHLAEMGLPVPKPLLFEPEETELGAPFFLCERFAGVPPGDYFGLWTKCPGAMRDLASALGRLHSIPPKELGFDVGGDDPGALLRERLQFYWKSWQANATRGSALIDFAFAWAEEKAHIPFDASPSVVHSDIGGHNLLVANDRLTAILDWEFIHCGDPAEDLGVARYNATQCMDWDEFMQIYRNAGGPSVPQERIDLGELFNWLMGAHLVAISSRNFAEGATSIFMKGANSFAGLRDIELKIARVLERILK